MSKQSKIRPATLNAKPVAKLVATPAPTPNKATAAPVVPAKLASKPNGKPVKYAAMPLHAGVRLYATVSANPRRQPAPGQKAVGYHAMQALIAAGKAGLTWTEYKAKGGRSEDARWDVARGWARFEETKTAAS